MDLSATLASLIQEESRRLGLALSVLKPARVVSHDVDAHTAEVEVLWPVVFRAADGAIVKQPIPPITVPVWRWIFGGFELVFTLAPGEAVGLVVADRALGPHLAAGPATEAAPLVSRDPEVSRAHDLSDAIAIPGLLASELGAAAEAPVILRHLSGRLSVAFYPDGRVLFAAGGEADQAWVRGDALAGHLSAHRAWALGHSHPADGAPPSTQPPDLPGDLLSALLKLR